MSASPLLSIAFVCAILAVLVLRIGWGRATRSTPVNAVGWALFMLAAIFGWAGAGAWGTAVTALWGMGAALVALAIAAISAAPGKARASNRRVGMLPEGGEPINLGRRIGTFLISVPLALAVSLGLSVVVFALSDLGGLSKADSIVLAFFATPVFWAIVAHLVLIRQRRKDQWLILAVCALPVVPVIASGMLT